MQLQNSKTEFGLVTRFIHWGMALAVFGMLGFGAFIARMEPALDRLWMYGAHKSCGILLLVFVIFRIGWHTFSAPPEPLQNGPKWQDMLARITHRALYVMMIAMPLSGWLASSASGIDTVLFNSWSLPRIAPVSEGWESAGFAVHRALGIILAGLLILHVAGAFKRRDGTLRRMITGQSDRL